ncbi:MAG TPA: hypothetical protein VK691_11635 [Solirubrobacteraceae bacterium]|jgi:hypothetical protein|nr:hypothetical protein [Solirubrobacteraceae bacterium]
MPHANTRNRKPAVVAVVVLLLACLGLAACGGSSSKTTSSSANAASTGGASGTSSTSSTGSTATTPGAPGSGRGSARFVAMRECLQKNGIALPKPTPGSRPGGGFVPGAGAGGGPQLPNGVTRAQYEAALKKCGGGSVHFFRNGAAGRLNNPVFKAALAKYGDCLRENGIKLPAPNTSGNGPIFDTKGIDTGSSQFKSASAKCRSTLIGAFRRPAGAPGATGAPPAGGAPAGGESSTG